MIFINYFYLFKLNCDLFSESETLSFASRFASEGELVITSTFLPYNTFIVARAAIIVDLPSPVEICAILPF